MNEPNIHIAIVEDEDEIRNALALIINGTSGFTCKHVFADAESALDMAGHLTVDVFLVDIQLPGMSGIEMVKRLKGEMANTDFLMLTVQSDDDSIFESLYAGASGYLLKDMDPADLLSHIREVCRGGSPMSSQIARRIVNSFRIVENPLSERETEILKLLSRGMNYKSVAGQLFLSPHTVKTHIKNIYGKLHVNSRAEAVYKAIKQKLI